ncbi:MAG: hypothetical protein HY736_03950 [Verrucomicrobia bacterium]|nr:hypothetical protein [Verrucomicrobiota bacterium]
MSPLQSALLPPPPLPRFLLGATVALLAFVAFATGASVAPAESPAALPSPVLFPWERGIALRIPDAKAADMYLWFYEWNMFEAMQAGQHTHGTYKLDRKLNPAGTEAVIESPAVGLTVRVVPGGAELFVRITNRTDYAWPEIAGIIPCWNPGQVAGTNPSSPLPLNRNFSDPGRTRTFFVSATGLTPLNSRAIHFNASYRAAVDRASAGGTFLFSSKWPTSDVNATAGLLVRESEDGRWVTGVAWEDYLSVQGHNPWSCLHACIRAGALKPAESRTIRGRLYLFQGRKEDVVAQFARDFPATLREGKRRGK